MRIILIEDDGLALAWMYNEFTRTFRDANIETLRTETEVVNALNAWATDPPSLIVLDLMLPRMSGLELCRKLRAEGAQVPILMLTAKQEESDKVLGLQSGADDYVTKPFGVHEFVARASALVRRHEAWRPGSSTVARRIVSAKGLAIDPATRRVFRDEQEVHLTTQEFALIYMLASNPDIVFSRAEIIEKVWQPDVFVDDRVVDTLVKRLRRKVEDDPAQPRRVLTAREGRDCGRVQSFLSHSARHCLHHFDSGQGRAVRQGCRRPFHSTQPSFGWQQRGGLARFHHSHA
jgi:DNA-binding response OmpR family regulator